MVGVRVEGGGRFSATAAKHARKRVGAGTNMKLMRV
jgi:hypothetical protein